MFKAFFSPIYWQSIYVLTRASLVRLNKNSVLGSMWSLIQPFVYMCVISYIFSALLRQPPETMIKNLAASIPLWNFLHLSLTNTSLSLLTRENILKKCRISRTMFIIADVAVAAFTLAYSIIAMYLLLAILYPSSMSFSLVLTPLVILPFVLSVTAVSVAFAFITPYIRDVPQIIQLALSTLYWTVPIVYPYSMVPESKRFLFEYNPLFLLIRPMQELVAESRFPDTMHMIKAVIVMILSIAVSYWIYRKCSRNVVYYV